MKTKLSVLVLPVALAGRNAPLQELLRLAWCLDRSWTTRETPNLSAVHPHRTGSRSDVASCPVPPLRVHVRRPSWVNGDW